MPQQTRQLAAIIFTDIVGYTALMDKDEEAGFALCLKRTDLFTSLWLSNSMENSWKKWVMEFWQVLLR